MAGIGVIVNPRSRRNLRDPSAAHRLARALGDRGIVRTAANRDELARIAADFRKLKIDVLGISGGDGTNHVTLTGFLEVYADEPLPPIAFLRGGTMNTVANAVGVPRGGPDGLLASLVARYSERGATPLRSIERHVMRVHDHYGFIFGTGALHGFMDEYYRSKDPNPLQAASVLLRASASVLVRGDMMERIVERWVGRILIDGGRRFPERDYLGIAAGTVDQVGLGFRPFYRCGDAPPDGFHLLGIHTSALGFVRKLPDIWHARPMGDRCTYDELARHAVLEAKGGIVRYVLDGDLHEHRGPLLVQRGPKVKIIVEHKTGFRPAEPTSFPWSVLS